MVCIVVSSWQLFLQEQVRNSQSPRGCSLSLCQKLSDPCHPYFLITMGGDRWQYNTLGFVKHWRMWYWSILSCLGTHEDLGETCEVRRNIAYGVEQWKAPPAVPYCSSQLPGGGHLREHQPATLDALRRLECLTLWELSPVRPWLQNIPARHYGRVVK